jgi:uncharacterized protein
MTIPVRPIQATERYQSIDLLRGLALLGILVMNIQLFSMPFAASINPTALGDRGPVDFAIWLASHLLFDQKYMTIFSLLFGAGILIMTTRTAEKGGRAAVLHYRRMFWLLVFGLLHAYLVWYGDILVLYAVCGAVVYLLRGRRPLTLLVLGLLVLSVESVLMIGGGLSIRGAPPEALQEFTDFFAPGPASLQEEIAAFQGGWLTQMPLRVRYSWEFHTFELWIWGIWRAGGLMLIGMALFKWGVVTGERPASFYARLAVVGFAIGLPIVALGVAWAQARNWEAISSFFLGGQFNYWGSILVSLGWIGLFLFVWKSGVLRGLVSRLVAVGRTAFSCYILTSIICTFIFYGHGLGLFGTVGRPGQLLVTVAVWITLLIVAPLWLSRYRFGPLEWLWRSLTYGERQSMRRQAWARNADAAV